ncbi:MAG: nucleoside kinase [Lachnospiraceae bacterium]|nr:nucleoside kinase [Lachnospiraceae bacterium]
MVQVTIGSEKLEYEAGTTFETIAEKYQAEYGDTIALVLENGKIRELAKTVEKDCELQFLTFCADAGHKTYVRTAAFILMKALRDVCDLSKVEKIKLEFAIGSGYYVDIKGDVVVDNTFAEKTKKRMQQLVEEDREIKKQVYPTPEAIELFRKQGMNDKVKLFKYRKSSTINVYELDGFCDYYYGYMLPRTGYVRYFDLIPYESGLILNLPEKHEPAKLQKFVPRAKLFDTLRRSDDWGEKLGVDTVGDLNDHICKGDLNDLILVQEALQERRIGEIAKEISEKPGVKFVMIAGPSSSGKTTFSHRLSIQLRTYGMTPHPIALDDYFVDREKTPLDENGDYNFECLEALDVEQFNQDMLDLLAGKEVELPTFNFKTGKREYKGNVKKLGPDDILVLEGIHGLNDKMSHSLPVESKYKIYISALTTLNIDEHNRIPTTDGRLLRRMVRDARTRGSSAKRTIQMWGSVRRGEEENIFPYQEEADAFFNSASIYELAALKQYAEPLLYEIGKDEPEYYEAKRLLKFLEYFLGMSTESIPNNSIVREFVGGSCFPV